MSDIEDVRVISGGGPDVSYLPQERKQRTGPQRHADSAFDEADTLAETALDAIRDSVAWAESLGVEVPLKVRGVETTLSQWITELAEERRRRG